MSTLLVEVPQGGLKGWAKGHILFSHCRSSTNVTVPFVNGNKWAIKQQGGCWLL